METSKYFGRKDLLDDDFCTTKPGTPTESRNIDKTLCGEMSDIQAQYQSLVGEHAIVYRLKNSCSSEKAFSLFKNYLLRNKLEIVNDSYNVVMAKLKEKGNGLKTFFNSFKSSNKENNVYLSISFMSTPRLLILSLSNQSKDSSKLYKYTSELVAHGSAFKQYLWENNSINVS